MVRRRARSVRRSHRRPRVRWPRGARRGLVRAGHRDRLRLGARAGDWRGQAFRYAIVSGASLLGNAVGEALIVRHGTNYIAGRVVISVIVGMAWNFPMHRYFVFRAPPPEAEVEPALADATL